MSADYSKATAKSLDANAHESERGEEALVLFSCGLLPVARSLRFNPSMSIDLTQLWQEHTKHEFVTRDAESTLATMVEDAYVNHVPVMTGGRGKDALRAFYSRDFIPCMPPDTTLTPISRTIGESQLVDEMIFSFTHTVEMPWMLPGIPPTGRRVEVPLVAIVGFRDGKLAAERIYWDQASVLKQIGLLSDSKLPVFGVETARKLTG